MQFGLLYEIEVPRPWTETSVSDGFWEALEQVKVAEEVGFSHVFSVEHHFLDQFSVASAPEVWLAAVAQHTSKIRIGHGVVRFNCSSRCDTSMFGQEYSIRDMLPQGSVYSASGEEWVNVAWRRATSFPD